MEEDEQEYRDQAFMVETYRKEDRLRFVLGNKVFMSLLLFRKGKHGKSHNTRVIQGAFLPERGTNSDVLCLRSRRLNSSLP